MDGVNAIHPPMPYNTPWDRARCVVLVANELTASERHMKMRTVVDSQHCRRGHANQ